MTTDTDYSRKWYSMAAVAMGIFLATIDGSIVNIALPTLVKSLQTDFATVQWVMISYLLTVTTLMLGVGRLADMWGKKKLYLSGFILFTLASVLCGLAPDVYWLIGFRVLQGVGSALIMALGAAIVTESFPPQERGKAMGIIGTVVSIGIITGPALGGVMLSIVSWHWIFFVNLPVGILGTWMVVKYISSHQPAGRQKFDFTGAILMFVSLLSLLIGLNIGQRYGFTETAALVLFAIFVLTLVWFVLVEQKKTFPMMDLKIFKNLLFSINLITGFLSFVAISGLFILLPFYLEEMKGYPTHLVGAMMSVFPIMLGLTSPIAGSFSDRWGTRKVSLAGLFLLCVGFLSVFTLTENTDIFGYIIRMIPLGIGMGIFQSPNNSAIMGSVPKERLGIASGLLSVSRTLGQTVGIAVVGAFWAFRIRLQSGMDASQSVNTALSGVQVSALQDTFILCFAIMAVGFLLAGYALFKEGRDVSGVSL